MMARDDKAGSQRRMLRVWSIQELLLLLREPVAVFFSLALPLVVYVFLCLPYAEEPIPDTDLRFIDKMFPSLIGTIGANLLLMGLPIYVAELRSRQVDRRYKALPLPGKVFGAAITIAMLVMMALASAIIIAVVGLAHGLRAEAASPAFIVLNLSLIAFLCAVGFFFGTLPFGARTIQALTAAIFFILFFGSGAAGPIDPLPEWFKGALEWNPLKIWFDALVRVYAGADVSSGTMWRALLMLALGTALALIGLRDWRRTE